MLKFSKSQAGKWVATKGERIVASAKNFSGLREKVGRRSDKADIRYNLVPSGRITGTAL
jgi:hypothetical protein